jgi:hypothetical protein
LTNITARILAETSAAALNTATTQVGAAAGGASNVISERNAQIMLFPIGVIGLIFGVAQILWLMTIPLEYKDWRDVGGRG